MKITAEDLLHIDREINDKYAEVFVGVERGMLYLHARIKELNYREVITPEICRNEPKKLVIDRFAHKAKRYLVGV